jgi:hypothetical protein
VVVVKTKYMTYLDELAPVFGGGDEGGQKKLEFLESMDAVATGISVTRASFDHVGCLQ